MKNNTDPTRLARAQRVEELTTEGLQLERQIRELRWHSKGRDVDAQVAPLRERLEKVQLEIDAINHIRSKFVAALVKAAAAGHEMEHDPPHALASADRYTCKHCGKAVLGNFSTAYGSALESKCTK